MADFVVAARGVFDDTQVFGMELGNAAAAHDDLLKAGGAEGQGTAKELHDLRLAEHGELQFHFAERDFLGELQESGFAELDAVHVIVQQEFLG